MELSFTRTKIVELETKLRDKEQSLEIFMQKVKILEEQRHFKLHDNYFPSKNDQTMFASQKTDCSCQLQAKINTNSSSIILLQARLSDLEKRIKFPNLATSETDSSPLLASVNSQPFATVSQPSNVSAEKSSSLNFETHLVSSDDLNLIPEMSVRVSENPSQSREFNHISESDSDFEFSSPLHSNLN